MAREQGAAAACGRPASPVPLILLLLCRRFDYSWLQQPQHLYCEAVLLTCLPLLAQCVPSSSVCFVPPPLQAAAATAADPLGSTIVGTYGYMAPEQVRRAWHGWKHVAQESHTAVVHRSTTS